MKSYIFISIIAGSLFFMQCSGIFDNDDPGDVIVSVSSDKTSFTPDDPVMLTVTVTNETDTTFQLLSPTGCVLSATVEIENEPRLTMDDRVCTQSGVTILLDPGEEYSETWPWHGDYFEGDTLIYLPAGTWPVRGVAGDLVSQPIELEFHADF